MMQFIGLDIGGTKCAVLLAHIDAGIHFDDAIRFDTHAERGFDDTLARLYEAIDTMMARHTLDASNVCAIGVSCGGPLDSRSGVILAPPNLPGWVNVPLPAMLTARYGMPAHLLNDANACALVEWKLGAGRGTRDMIFLTMGTGMGAGVIAEGQLLRGHTDMGGEVGHLRLAEDGPVGFGKAGSLEGFTSGGGIARQAQALTRRLCAEGNPPVWTKDGVDTAHLSAKIIADYARAGDPVAADFFASIGDWLGKGLALLVDSFNPECIVIGSIFARCEDLLRPTMEATLQREAIPRSLVGLRVVPAETGEALGDYASIMVALYAMDIDPLLDGGPERDETVLVHYRRLLEKHPQLADQGPAILEAYGAIRDCYRRGGKLLLAGNGGSSSDAQHIVGELMKGFYSLRPLPEADRQAIERATADSMPEAASLLQGAMPAIALGEHSALTSAFGNDVHAALGFSQQLLGYGKPGDVYLGLSTSGNARNVLIAAQVARARGLTAIGLTGGTGGKLAQAVDIAIIAPGDNPATVQELHLPIYHALCAMLEAKFFPAKA